MVAVAQVEPTAGSPTAVVGTFLVTAAVYALTLHVAARYVLGDVDAKRAVPLGLVLAALAFAGQRNAPAVVLGASLLVDYVGVKVLYDRSHRLTALIVVVHVTVAIILGLVLSYLVVLLSTAPA